MKAIDVSIDFETQDFAKWIGNVPDRIQTELNNKIRPLKRNTKKVVKDHLQYGAGVETGIYKKSFTIIDLSENKWHIGFQVVAKKPHYRLTHLLENGHRIKIFTPGRGEQTKRGNIGMSFVTTLRTGARTHSFPHIEPAQTYADNAIIALYKDTVNRKFSERN
jgi:hypothetical protein